MPNSFNFKFKVQIDGKRAYLFKDAAHRGSISWSEKEGGFRISYSPVPLQAELERDPTFCIFMQRLLTYMLAYKKDADKLQALHDAFQHLINE